MDRFGPTREVSKKGSSPFEMHFFLLDLFDGNDPFHAIDHSDLLDVQTQHQPSPPPLNTLTRPIFEYETKMLLGRGVISFGWFADFGKPLTIIQLGSTLVPTSLL